MADLTVTTTLPERIAELLDQHGSLRAAARVLDVDPGYLSRLQSGEKDEPSDTLLRRMRLRRVVSYERIGKAADGVAPVEAPSNDPAPPNSLPDWYECQRILDNANFRKRAAEGLEGSVLDTHPTTPDPTALHRFIYEYDDSDPYRSAWFLHRLELVLKDARTSGVNGNDGQTGGPET